MTSTITSPSLRLLVAEDSEDDYELLLREVRRTGYAVTARRVDTPEQLASALAERWDLIVTDWIMPAFGGRQVLDTLAAAKVDAPTIVVSGTPGEEPAVQALRAGALDFLSKDKPRRIGPAIQRALSEAAEHRARLRAERELRLSEERYRTGFEVAPEPLLTYDLDHRQILDANSRALELFKKPIEELRALPVGGLSPERQPDGQVSSELLLAYIRAALVGEEPQYPWTFLVDGELVPTEVRISRLPTSEGNLARFSIVDLRERLKSEALRHRSAQLEQQNRRIQEASRLKSEFLANMSHELRTPLNAIIGFTELLYDGQVEPTSAQHREFLGDILTSGRHLLQLINDVLDLAKVEAGKLDFRPEPIDLKKLLGEVTAILRTQASSKRIRLETSIDPSVTDVVADPARLKQIAYNYLSNALKFTKEGGRVTARVLADGTERFRFEVEDTGVGISQADLGRLFVEFQQLEAGAAKRHQGTGLGLALTRRIVEAQGGSVGVRSVVEQGSTFHAILPRKPVVFVPQHRPASVVREGARAILVVEDDPRDQTMIVNMLANAGYAVELATTGEEALAHYRTGRFSAVTTDLLLPDMSGLDLLDALQIDGRFPVPVLVVTVVPDTKVVAGFAVHDVLHKPLDRDVLLASLSRAGVGPQEAAR